MFPQKECIMTILRLKMFILNGFYTQMKYEEDKLKKLKEVIREDQAGLNKKRMVWKESGVVGEFVGCRQYEYNHSEFNEMLYHHGILPVVSSIETKALTEEEVTKLQSVQIPSKSYVSFSPNKGCAKVKYEETDLANVPLNEKVALWKEAYTKYKFLNSIWEKERTSAIHSEVFRDSKHSYFELGYISLVVNPATYCTQDVLNILGNKALMKCARVNMDKLIDYTAKGFLNISDINKFRAVIGVCERYILMTLSNENAKRDFWNARLDKLSLLSQNSKLSD